MVSKYADETAQTRQIAETNDSHLGQEIDSFVQWCDLNYTWDVTFVKRKRC